MAILKCKICGGDMELSPDKTFGTCEYCGTTMTLPKIDDEQRAAAFNRGNHFRRSGEFDKALQVYERIVDEAPDDAEAHWCCALCRFGIEWVEDPATLEYLPTCHRASFDPFTEDVDCKAAIELSDGITKRQYQKDAARISEVQKGILAASQNEKPFDVFICYKESDDNGNRTVDSTLAQEVYYQLVDQGLRVFFARITLEDKVGTEYEPYIFAALNSAKAMVVIGTKPEHFNSVWVKNEWSRYLSIVRRDRSKVLLPCYRDMDPYDLPEQLSILQSYDMSKIGFMQDLIRGIKKIVGDAEPKTAVKETVVIENNANVAPLLERAFLFLEDGKWQDANTYCEKVLDIDPKNAEAYLGKLMAELQVRTRKQLAGCSEPFDCRDNYGKVLRFGDEKIESEMRGYIAQINERNENARLTAVYIGAVNAMNESNSEAEYKAASEKFKTIPGFKDADSLVEQCLDKAEICRKDAIYSKGRSMMSGGIADSYETAIKTFERISGYKDADEQIQKCRRKIEEIKAKEEADRLEAERKAEQARLAAEKRKKKAKKIAAIVTPVVAVCVVIAILIPTVIMPNAKYNAAVKLFDSEKYDEAIVAFKALDGYKDSAEQIKNCENAKKDQQYDAGLKLFEDGKYDEAITAFKALNGHKDSAEQISRCETAIKDKNYNNAVQMISDGKHVEAYEALISLNGYKDSAEIAKELLKNNRDLLLKTIKIGDCIVFGTYEQDNNTTNGKEDIEWLVIAKNDNKSLIISRYALDCQQYNTSFTDVTWETCSLRKWLNGTFFNSAFSSDEQNMIQATTVTADKNPSYSTPPGNTTTDKLFLLSITEVNKNFKSDSVRQCRGTAYCYARGAYKADNGNCWWWLRSPGYDSLDAAYVLSDGEVRSRGSNVGSTSLAVRPALWINLGS